MLLYSKFNDLNYWLTFNNHYNYKTNNFSSFNLLISCHKEKEMFRTVRRNANITGLKFQKLTLWLGKNTRKNVKDLNYTKSNEYCRRSSL